MYSGTVAAAREASRHGIPALAVSQAYDEHPINFREAARFARSAAKILLGGERRHGACLNINVPAGEVRGAKITRQGCSYHFPPFDSLDKGTAADAVHPGSRSALPTDYHTLKDKFISITPLQRDQTDYGLASKLREEMPGLSRGRRLFQLGLNKQPI